MVKNHSAKIPDWKQKIIFKDHFSGNRSTERFSLYEVLMVEYLRKVPCKMWILVSRWHGTIPYRSYHFAGTGLSGRTIVSEFCSYPWSYLHLENLELKCIQCLHNIQLSRINVYAVILCAYRPSILFNFLVEKKPAIPHIHLTSHSSPGTSQGNTSAIFDFLCICSYLNLYETLVL